MKIAIPSSDASGLDSRIFPHFGRCPFYTLVDIESGRVAILPNTSIHFGGFKSPPELLLDKGVTVLICKDLGEKAVSLFQDAGIDVYIGARGVVKEAIEAWKRGELEKPSDEYVCEGHR